MKEYRAYIGVDKYKSRYLCVKRREKVEHYYITTRPIIADGRVKKVSTGFVLSE